MDKLNILKIGTSEFEIADAEARENIAGILNDYTELSADVDDLNNAVFETTNVPFNYVVGDVFDLKAPYMATEKYGIRTLADIYDLSISFNLFLNASCSIRFEIRDSEGNIYGTQTKEYTISASGDSVHVDVTFDFAEELKAGQYYFWMFSSVASSMSYAFNNSTFPTYEYIELTADGGWNNSVNNTSLTSYRMYLRATISGNAISKTDKVNKLAKDVELNQSYSYKFIAWNKNNTDTFVASETGFTASSNHNMGGTTKNSAFDTNECINYSPYFNVSMNIDSTGYPVTVYLAYVDTDDTVQYRGLKTINSVSDESDISIDVDLAYYQQYQKLGNSFGIIVACNQTASWTMTVSDFTVKSILTTDDVGDNVADYLGYLNNQVSAISAEVTVSKPVYLTASDGSKYALQVDTNGNITGTSVIPQKTLFVGNSLLVGNGSFGMCATDNQHDYYHYVSSEILESNSNATFNKLSGASFESATDEATANNWMTNTLLPLLASDTELVIVQLGDNVTADKVSAFEVNCKNLLAYIRNQCPNARVAWVGEWYSSSAKQTIIANACNATGAVFVNIADLATRDNQARIGDVIHKTSESTTTYTVDSFTDDATNKILTVNFTVDSVQYTSELPYTSYTSESETITVTGYYTIVTLAGVASHPSNAGMLKIANRICYMLGITDSESAIS